MTRITTDFLVGKTMNESVIRDDVSETGVHRLHLLKGGSPPDYGPVAMRILNEGGEAIGVWKWVDDLGMHHLYVAWRWTMYGYPMWMSKIQDGDVLEAVRRAAINYQRRNGRWPDRAITRVNGKEIPEGVQLVDQEQAVIGVVKIEQVETALQTGTVAVFCEPSGDDTEADVERPEGLAMQQ